MDKPKSITHEHLLSIINTEASQLVGIKGLRILDAGCGDGTFLSYLVRNLPLVFSNLSVTPKFEYPMRRPGLSDFLCVLFARYISIVTLFLQKRETYRRA
jgi:hypothetical protein